MDPRIKRGVKVKYKTGNTVMICTVRDIIPHTLFPGMRGYAIAVEELQDYRDESAFEYYNEFLDRVANAQL